MSSENNARNIYPRINGVVVVAIKHGAAEKNADKNTQRTSWYEWQASAYAHSFIMIMPNKGK